MKKYSIVSRLAACCGLLTAITGAQATQTDNFGLHAVPAPKTVTIDGALAEWDLSGEVLMCYDMETLQDRHSGRVSAMYDADNLYVAVRWKDPTPMGNIHDPHFQAEKAWAGDSIQLRIMTDKISHVTGWYYAGGEEPGMLIDYGVGLNNPFGGGSKKLLRIQGWKLQEGAEMAFKKDEDGKGYVQEIKIPWALITESKKYVAGERLQVGVELLWGEADWPVHRYADNLAEGASGREFFFTAIKNWGDVILEPKGNLKLPEPSYLEAFRKAQIAEAPQGPVEITYTLPADAKVTLAIDTSDGRRVRNLIPAASRKAGKNTERWDGLDDAGKPVEPGQYTFKVIYHDGIHANYALSFANPGNPTWDTSDGRGAFYGDHTMPMAAAAAGNYVALACPMGEAGKHLIGLNLDGQRLWGLANRTAFDGGRISLATDGKILWVGNEGKEATVYRVHIADGKYAPWNQTAKLADDTLVPVLDLKVSEEPGMGTKERPPANLRAIALNPTATELAIVLFRENLVKILDADTGNVVKTLSVPEPSAITHDGKGWLVLSAGKINRLSVDGKLAPFADNTFANAFGLASDQQGNVYLSVWGGADAKGGDQNVKVFSSAGKLIHEIGKSGGRPEHGAFIAEAMRRPSGIAVDSQGHLWVTEATRNPKRSSVWDTKTGALLKDLSGTTGYAGSGTINPFDPTMGFSDDTVYQIDWETGTSRPVYSIAKSGNPDEIFNPSVHDLTSRVMQHGGRTYVFTSGTALASGEVHVMMFDGKDWRSVAHLGTVQQGTHVKKESDRAVYSTGGWAKYQHPFFAGHDLETYAWADENGDGIVQPAELHFATIKVDGTPVTLRHYYWGQLPDVDGTVTYMITKSNDLVQFPVVGYTKCGATKYDPDHPRIIHVDQPRGGGNGEGQIIGGSKGRVFINEDPLIAIASDGKVLGTYPSKFTSVHGSHHAKASRPGYVIGPSSFLGVVDLGNEKQGGAGEVFYLNGNLGENYLFTYDGLYIQTLFKDTRGGFEIPDRAVRGMPMDNVTAGGESFGGNFIRTPEGKCYVTLGATDARVMEVTGLDSIRRLNGKFTYTKGEYADAQKQAQDRAVEANQPKVYRIAKATTPLTLDGKADEWQELLAKDSTLVEIQESAQKRYGRVQLRYDADNLYVAWRVFAPRNEMKNGGQDYRLLFKTGDVVDIMVGPAEQVANGVGNSRIVLSTMGGKPVAVLNQPKVPGAPKSESFEFASPWRSFVFDRVVLAPEVKMAIGGNLPGGGYLVEASIPWKTLGVKPASGLKLLGDVGVLFGDQAGIQTIARHYWSNQNVNLVNDVPGEAELTPKLWGTLELE